ENRVAKLWMLAFNDGSLRNLLEELDVIKNAGDHAGRVSLRVFRDVIVDSLEIRTRARGDNDAEGLHQARLNRFAICGRKSSRSIPSPRSACSSASLIAATVSSSRLSALRISTIAASTNASGVGKRPDLTCSSMNRSIFG